MPLNLDERRSDKPRCFRSLVFLAVAIVPAIAWGQAQLNVRATASPDTVPPDGIAEVTVLVLAPSGAPIEGARATLAVGGGGFVESGTSSVSGPTDAQGVFRARWRALPASAYAQGGGSYAVDVQVTSERFPPAQASVTIRVNPSAPPQPPPTVTGPALAGNVILAELPMNVEARVTPTAVGPGGLAEIMVRAVDEKGAPVTQARVSLSAGGGTFRESGNRFVSGQTDFAGIYRVQWEAMGAGAYYANVDYEIMADVSKEGFRPDTRRLTITVDVSRVPELPSSLGSVPACTPQQNSQWERAQRETMGVIGRDPHGSVVGQAPADRTMIIYSRWNWWPIAPNKTTLCGTLHHFQIHALSVAGNYENDWNNYIIPDPPFRYLLEDPKPFHSLGDWAECDGVKSCMEAEVTPSYDFVKNPWFPGVDSPLSSFGLAATDPSRSPARLNQKLCTYGPYVLERSHDYRPEIHPSELFWWREDGPRPAYVLMMVLDESNRFSQHRHFWLSKYPAPPQWRPWADAPHSGQFRIAFEVRPDRETLQFTVRQETRGRVAETAKDQQLFDNALVLNGRSVVSVSETQPVDDDVGVGFEDVCRAPDGERVRGFLTLASEIQRGGYHVLRVETSAGTFAQASIGQIEQQTPGMATALPTMTEARTSSPTALLIQALGESRGAAKVSLDVRSLRRTEVGGRPTLVADVEFPGSLRQVAIRGETPTVARLRPAASPGAVGSRTVAESLPVLRGGLLEVQTNDGRTETAALPAVALLPSVLDDRVVGQRDAPELWGVYAQVGGVAVSANMPPVRLTAVEARVVEVGAEYAPALEGGRSAEDPSPVSAALNDALLGSDGVRRSSLFGTETPLRVRWSFTATDMLRGGPVPVAVNASVPSPDAVVVEFAPRTLPGGGTILEGQSRIRFPARAGTIVRLSAEVEIEDSFGTIGRESFLFWSHVLTHDQGAQALATAVASELTRLAGVPARASSVGVFGAATPAEASPAAEREAWFEQLLSAEIRLVADDAEITPEELAGLVRGVRQPR